MRTSCAHAARNVIRWREASSPARQRDPDLARRTWALKTTVEQRRRESAAQALRIVDELSAAGPATRPLRLLHLSDLHITAETSVLARLQPLVDDLRRGQGMGFDELDYLVISGDFTDRGNTTGFEKAYEFVSRLTSDFGLNAQRCVFVPGNHDVVETLDAYTRRRDTEGLRDGEWVQEGKLILARDPEKYPQRFKPIWTTSSTNSCSGRIRSMFGSRAWRSPSGTPAFSSSP